MEESDLAGLALRMVIGTVFFAHGWNHAFGTGGIDGTATWLSGFGMRWPRFQAVTSAVVEIAGGTMLIMGAVTPLACSALGVTYFVVWVTAHRTNGFFIFRDGYEYVMALAVVALSRPLVGPGGASVDALLGNERLSTSHPAAIGVVSSQFLPRSHFCCGVATSSLTAARIRLQSLRLRP